jgi:hypothetical protein
MRSGYVTFGLVASALLVLYFGLMPERWLNLAVEAVTPVAPAATDANAGTNAPLAPTPPPANPSADDK